MHLEGLYADGEINPDQEVARLIGARRIVLQFPVQWYSTPPLLQMWQDTVPTRMFYMNAETDGAQIAGRPLLVAATAGDSPSAYSASGVNLFPLPELLLPLRATAHRCGLGWQEPFLVYEARSALDAVLEKAAQAYSERLRALGTLRGGAHRARPRIVRAEILPPHVIGRWPGSPKPTGASRRPPSGPRLRPALRG